jgi:hypothetical protein
MIISNKKPLPLAEFKEEDTHPNQLVSDKRDDKYDLGNIASKDIVKVNSL